MNHIPVLLKEVIEVLSPRLGDFFVDGTIGSGGHSREILKKIGPKGKLLGVDWDKEAIARCKSLMGKRKNVILIKGNYAELPKILREKKLDKANGLLLDLGFSSEHLGSGRGFSFLRNEPLDMRYQLREVRPPEIDNQYLGGRTSSVLTAAKVINTFGEMELADVFWKYGEERFSRKIAKKIIEERKKKPVKTTFELVEIIKKAIPFRHCHGHRYGRQIHPATRVFQALRIYVNDELGNLEKLLKNLAKILAPAGRAVIISYHSLEDRLVKNYFRELKNQGKALIITKKPIRPTLEEIKENPRSRSAKLRAIQLQ